MRPRVPVWTLQIGLERCEKLQAGSQYYSLESLTAYDPPPRVSIPSRIESLTVGGVVQSSDELVYRPIHSKTGALL
jgi:hypothetical protein